MLCTEEEEEEEEGTFLILLLDCEIRHSFTPLHFFAVDYKHTIPE